MFSKKCGVLKSQRGWRELHPLFVSRQIIACVTVWIDIARDITGSSKLRTEVGCMLKIYMGVLAAFFSSILVSISVNVISPGEGDVSAAIFLYTFPFYLFFGIPFSILIDRVFSPRKWWLSLLYYTLIGLGLWGTSLFTFSLEKEERLTVFVFIMECAWMYFIVLTILGYGRKKV